MCEILFLSHCLKLEFKISNCVDLITVMILGSLCIPAVYNAPVYKPAKGNLAGQSLPCVVFSHGLGGNRLIYSTYCCELASQGCLVACIEHRYGSSNRYFALVYQ